MRRSKIEIYVHFVWTTHRRMPLIVPEIETAVHESVAGEARRLGCEVLAVGGTADHVHLAASLGANHAIADLMRRVKGASSTRIRREIAPDGFFGWQDHYGAFSFGSRHRQRVIEYIRDQKRHHATSTTWEAWEA